MAVRVAINGFGRIGRLAFRQMFGAEGYEVVAINDLTSPKMLAHLLKYDSSQGKYEHADEVSASDDSITVCGKEIKIYAFPDANNCPWGELKVDVVLECSGFYTSKEKAQAHINAGARKVVISVDYNIAVRTGLQCAPKVHEVIGTFDIHGTVRMSIGAFTTEEDVNTAIEAVKEIAAIRN